MSKRNGKNEVSVNGKNNGLGPVAREKYETILQARVRQCIAAQETKIKTHRAKALRMFLEQNKLSDKLAKYRGVIEELIAFFGEPDWVRPSGCAMITCSANKPKCRTVSMRSYTG